MTMFPRRLARFLLLLVLSLAGEEDHLFAGQADVQDNTRVTIQHDLNDIQRRLDRIDVQRQYTQELVKTETESSRSFLTVFGVIIGVIVSVQSIFQGLSLRHQWARDSGRDVREAEKDASNNTSAKAVADVLAVVKNTLDARLTEENKARDEAAGAKNQVNAIRAELDRVVSHFERLARTAHDRIEVTASRLAAFRRHEFKEIPERLADLALQYDEYELNLQPLAPQTLVFSARVLYVRGIAAHYASQPDLVKTHLSEVTKQTAPEKGETEIASARRVGNAYYYLALNESNFGNYGDALHLLNQASESLDPNDLLSRIVIAECYLFSEQYQRGLQYLNEEIDCRIREMKNTGIFRGYHTPFEVRSAILQANVGILRGDSDWADKIIAHLDKFCEDEPDNYYALVSVAQALHAQKNSRAADLFDKAYEAIIRSRHLDTITEIRSRILLLTVAGICSKMGSTRTRKRMPEEFLEEAKRLLDRLPRRGSEECTVFSVITKRNENRNVIAGHIGQIEAGVVIPMAKQVDTATT